MAKATKTATPETQAAAAYDWSQEQNTGFEGTRAEDFGIPFLAIIQKGSPEVDKTHKDYELKKIEGAQVGQLFTTTGRKIVYLGDDAPPLQFVPVFHEKLYQEWKLKKNGGGFVASHRSPVILTQVKRNQDKEDILPNGNEIITTSYFYGYAINVEGEDKPLRVIIGMSSTQLKRARAWLNLTQSIKIDGKIPPMFSHVYDLSTEVESNNEGSWFSWKVAINRALTQADAPLIENCRELVKQCADGVKQLPTPTDDKTEDEDPFKGK